MLEIFLGHWNLERISMMMRFLNEHPFPLSFLMLLFLTIVTHEYRSWKTVAFSHQSLSTHSSSLLNFEFPEILQKRCWNCRALRELNFSFGKLLIHVSTHWIDSKNDVHGFVYLQHAAVYAIEKVKLTVTCFHIVPLWLNFGQKF